MRTGAVKRRANFSPIEASFLEPSTEVITAGSLVPAQLPFAGSTGYLTTGLFSGVPSCGPSRITRNLLMPKTIRWKKPHKPAIKPFRSSSKWKFKGYAPRGNKPVYGKFAIQAMEEAWISSKMIEDGRRKIVRTMERKGKMWIRIFPHNAITTRTAETRMGAGKGGIDYWCAVVRPDFILYELDGVTEETARLAAYRVSFILPLKTRFLKKKDGPSLFELGLAGKEKGTGGGRKPNS